MHQNMDRFIVTLRCSSRGKGWSIQMESGSGHYVKLPSRFIKLLGRVQPSPLSTQPDKVLLLFFLKEIFYF